MDVVILAGGLGTRLRSVVSEVPKCMAPVDGKPFLWYLLEQLRGYSIDRVVLSVGYWREVVQDWISAHDGDYPFEFRFAVEEEPLGTGGGIRLAASMVSGRDVVVLNGDTFFDVNLDLLVQARRESGLPVALALKPMLHFDRYGAVELGSDGVVSAFLEKRHCDSGLINGGVYALDPHASVFDGLPEKFSFEKSVLEPACAAGKLAGLVQDGFFIDIGVPEDYERACNEPGLLLSRLTLPGIICAAKGYDTLLLDRDGVINRLMPGDYVKSIEEFEWLPGVKYALRIAACKFRHIFVVTNQRGVGRGLMTQADLNDIHAWMIDEVKAVGGSIDGVYCCTAVSDTDPRRKPNPGLFYDICGDFPDVSASRTLMIGDSGSDRLFARNCGIGFAGVLCSGQSRDDR